MAAVTPDGAIEDTARTIMYRGLRHQTFTFVIADDDEWATTALPNGVPVASTAKYLAWEPDGASDTVRVSRASPIAAIKFNGGDTFGGRVHIWSAK